MATRKSVMIPEPIETETLDQESVRAGFLIQKWMLSLRDISRSDECPKTVSERCRLAGIEPTRFWYWAKKPEFRIWWNEQMDQEAELRLPDIHRTNYQKAVDGSFPHAKLFLERFDRKYVPHSKQTIEARPPPLVIAMGGTEERGLLSRLQKTEEGNAVIEAAPVKNGGDDEEA